jgi:protein TonB
MSHFKTFLVVLFLLLGNSYLLHSENLNIVPSNKELGALQGDPYLAFAESMPEPVGGLPAIYKKISYPSVAKSAGLEGKVYLLIFVNENGGVDNVKVIKGIGGGCEEEAVKAVKSIRYTPGKNKGVPVKVKLSLAITFKLKN